ncbi:hypothetical protein HYU06_04765 [Candidatus Woesearchaeota archaeon]|nr:hypothetical protein [Candidatus Woesearchaeota archaeon]
MNKIKSKKIYLDTNIYLDYLLNRKNRYGKDIGSIAFTIFNRALACEFEIVLSSWTSEELIKTIEPDKFMFLIQMLKAKNKLHLVKCEQNDIEQAKKLSEHYHDPLHAILAKKGNAEFVITRDLSGFECSKSIIKAYLPEQI